MSPYASKVELPATSSQNNSSEIGKSLVKHSNGIAGKHPDNSSLQSFEDYIKQHLDSHLNEVFASYKIQHDTSKDLFESASEDADAYLKNVQNVLDESRKQYKEVSGKIDAAYRAILNDFTSNPKFTPTSIVNHAIINKEKGGKKCSINAGGRIMKIPDIMELGQDIKIVIPSNAEHTPKDSQGNLFLDVNYHNANSIVVSKSNTKNSKKLKSNEHEFAQVSAFFSKNYKVLLDKDYPPLKFPTMLTSRSKLFTTSLGESLQEKISELIAKGGGNDLSHLNFLHRTNFSLAGKFLSSTNQEQTSPQEWNTLCHAISQHTHTMVFVKTSGATYIIYNAQKFPNQSTSILPNSSVAESFVKCSMIKDSHFCLLTAVKLDGDDNDLALTSYSIEEQDRLIVIPNSNKYLFKIGQVDEPLSLVHVNGEISIHDRLHQSIKTFKEAFKEDNNSKRTLVTSSKDAQGWIYDPVEEIEIFFQNNTCCHADQAEKFCNFHANLPLKIELKNYPVKDIPAKISNPIQRIRSALNQKTEKSLDVVNYILHQHARSAFFTLPDKNKAELVNIKIDSHSIITTTKHTLGQFPGSYLTVGENFIKAHKLEISLRKPLLEMSVKEVIVAIKAIDKELVQKSHDHETEHTSVEDITWETIDSAPEDTEKVFSSERIVDEDVSNQVIIRYFQKAELERFGDESYKIKHLIDVLKNTRMHAEYDLSNLTTREHEPITKASIHYVIDKMRIIHMSRYGIFPKHSDSIEQDVQFQNEMDDTFRTKDDSFVQEIMQAYKALNINPEYY